MDKRLDEVDFTIYFSSLEHAISEWPISELQNPENITELKYALENIPETTLTLNVSQNFAINNKMGRK